uniref:Cysteine string protein n=1 Tax=Panagrellus redivivus TaxID=6233 RepID=A0A7E4V364_PANRE
MRVSRILGSWGLLVILAFVVSTNCELATNTTNIATDTTNLTTEGPSNLIKAYERYLVPVGNYFKTVFKSAKDEHTNGTTTEKIEEKKKFRFFGHIDTVITHVKNGTPLGYLYGFTMVIIAISVVFCICCLCCCCPCFRCCPSFDCCCPRHSRRSRRSSRRDYSPRTPISDTPKNV